ncbi:TIGR00730 family Rossman fold protein [Levilactobacillus brevis]|uniref:LOG family protein n=1 Tax=Levilactobacillus brevis TaxID=1580 RepID=UPI0003FA41A9|nr:TIGR00730 family Rossman fold protein [Levilactobacillus brevis]ARN93432.1 Rossman fold protein, TIGR00730 family [Levilactobacillus brevis]ARN96032.1 Rossman fold protein, TIGR00730 family [Levilactobacillus brevis]ATU70759.1 TIGR00730 family Rossman fold protein [Levilactobacillus brevis]MBS1007176.1 TIGR00730 family Rossman fold protein [Levilactobacillus brevis]MBS1013986.1 TIGR00730 family Rossman fold protein [Levilactobacillus brevis]
MKRLAVYCGANMGPDVFVKATKEVAQEILDRDLELVYGGGCAGLMGVVAKTVLDGGGKIHGVIPQFLTERELLLEGVDDIEIVENMSIRKQKLLEKSDACLAVPGGPGTLEEIIEAFSWAILGQSENPCALYNVDGYYTPLEEMFDQMAESGYITQENRDNLFFSDNLDEIFDFFENYKQPKIREYN